jgi:hypothetical protein
MSKAEFLITVFTFLGAFVSGVAAIEQNIIKKLLKRGATSEQKAIELKKTKLISRWRLNRLKQLGAILESSSGKCYYNEIKYKTLLKRRIIAVITIVVIVFIITMIYFN